jgi:uncharacterized protein (DUF736 family)
MPTIGHVTKQKNGGYIGQLATLTVNTKIELVPVDHKESDTHPDFRLMAGDVEIGAAWLKVGKKSKEDYVSITITTPEFGLKKLYANLGRTTGQSDPNELSLIWNPEE